MTDEKLVAAVERMAVAANLTAALEAYVLALGPEQAGRQLALTLDALRKQAKYSRIMGRVRNARAGMAAAAQERGDWHPPDAVDPFADMPTPDYPERKSDEAWLRKHCGHGAEASPHV